MSDDRPTGQIGAHPPVDAPIRVLLLGMRCAFTMPVAAALLADPAIEVVAAIVPGAPAPPPVSGRPVIMLASDAPATPLDRLLRGHRISLIETPSPRKRELMPLLAKTGNEPPDALVVACFPWRVPRWLREFPRFGALNVHPSLLPALRGPEPEFWALRLALRETGVTIHLMDAGFDTGPILAQHPLQIRPDMTLPALEQSLAVMGGALMTEILHALIRGTATPRPQTGSASYAPTPGDYDLSVTTNLSAGWAAQFVRAVAPVYAPLRVRVMVTGQQILVDGVVDVDERGIIAAPVIEEGDAVVAVQFSPGVVRFLRTDPAIGRITDRRARS